MTLLDLIDDDFVAMLRGDAAIRPGLSAAPGGVDETRILEHVRARAAKLHQSGFVGGQWMMMADDEVVGLCGIKAPPSGDGEVEIGYGVAVSRRRRGHATAAVAAIIEIARRNPAIRSIMALTATDNVASHRVLKRNRFEQVEVRPDPDDGELFVWRRRLDNDENRYAASRIVAPASISEPSRSSTATS